MISCLNRTKLLLSSIDTLQSRSIFEISSCRIWKLLHVLMHFALMLPLVIFILIDILAWNR